MTSQPLLFDDAPPADPVYCGSCLWQGDGADLLPRVDDWGGDVQACPACESFTVLDGRLPPKRKELKNDDD